MNNNIPNELLEAHAKGKKRMIAGIVLIAVGIVLFYASVMVMMMNGGYVGLSVMSVIAAGLECAGIPLLISGIIRMSKASRQINSIRAENMRKPAEPKAEPYEEDTSRYEQEFEYQPKQEEEHEAETGSGGDVDIDWRKYETLDAGIAYDPNKNYKFMRSEGLAGSVPQSFVNRTFPKCPLCRTTDPYWTISQIMQMSMKGNLYIFKCSKCGGVISMSAPDVATLGNGGAGFAANASVGLTNLMVKKASGKGAGVVYAVIENVGSSGVDPQCQGREFKLDDLKEISER